MRQHSPLLTELGILGTSTSGRWKNISLDCFRGSLRRLWNKLNHGPA